MSWCSSSPCSLTTAPRTTATCRAAVSSRSSGGCPSSLLGRIPSWAPLLSRKQLDIWSGYSVLWFVQPKSFSKSPVAQLDNRLYGVRNGEKGNLNSWFQHYKFHSLLFPYLINFLEYVLPNLNSWSVSVSLWDRRVCPVGLFGWFQRVE